MKAKLIKPAPQEDAAIARGIAADPDTMEMSDEQFAAAAVVSRRGRPTAEVHKTPVTMRLDPDLVEAMRATGPGWQTRANEALRAKFISRRRVT